MTVTRKKGVACGKHPELAGLRLASGACVQCNRDKRKKWAAANRDKARAAIEESNRRLKKETFEAYGGAICSKCGHTGKNSLCLDHEGGGGGQKRKNGEHPWGGADLYRWLRQRGFPPGFRVLCFNCNAEDSVERLRANRK